MHSHYYTQLKDIGNNQAYVYEYDIDKDAMVSIGKYDIDYLKERRGKKFPYKDGYRTLYFKDLDWALEKERNTLKSIRNSLIKF